MKIAINLFLITALVSCNGMFYFPTRKFYFNPEKMNYAYENIFFKSKDGKVLHGWFFPSKDKSPKGTIIQFHGNAENITTHFLFLVWVVKHGYNLFIFDYRGYGNSQGVPSRNKIQQDAISALKWVEKIPKERKGKKTVLFAQSLGGIIAMNALLDPSLRKGIDLLVLDSTFPSYQNIARDKLADFIVTWPFQLLAYLLVSSNGDMNNKIQELSPLPILVIHGLGDRVVPYKFGKKIFDQAKPPKYLWSIKSYRHCSVFFVEKKAYRKKFIDFLNQL